MFCLKWQEQSQLIKLFLETNAYCEIMQQEVKQELHLVFTHLENVNSLLTEGFGIDFLSWLLKVQQVVTHHGAAATPVFRPAHAHPCTRRTPSWQNPHSLTYQCVWQGLPGNRQRECRTWHVERASSQLLRRPAAHLCRQNTHLAYRMWKQK